jgi:hypothetical protein
MDSFFDAKFYGGAMGSIFACDLARSGRDIPKSSQENLGNASASLPEKMGSDSCRNDGNDSSQRFPRYVVLEPQPVDAESLHCAAQFSYVPQPLQGWTTDEQLALIVASKTVKSKRSLMFEKCGMTAEIARQKHLLLLSKHVPGKSVQECARCLKHLEASRVAYFGQHHLNTVKCSKPLLFKF